MKTTITILFSILLFSCSSSDDSSIADFQGTWSGQYIGTGGTDNNGDNGTFSVIIDENGNVTGSATSIVFSATYQLTGTVNSSGTLSVSFGTSSNGGTFTGNLQRNGTASGTWFNNIPTPQFTGTWNGTKQ